jgi:hypothetical protein
VSTPVAYVHPSIPHPDDVLAVFDHPAVWVNGTAIQVIGVSWRARGHFLLGREYFFETLTVPGHLCGSSCGDWSPGPAYDGKSAAWCLDQYERMQRDDPKTDLSIPLTPRQLAVARGLWSERLRGLVMGDPA